MISSSRYDPNIQHRRTVRLTGYDYTQPGAYFVTIVAWHRECLFGEIVDSRIRFSPVGNIVHEEWQRLARHFPNIRLDAFVTMPNHFHGIIIIDPIIGATHPSPVGATHPSPDEILEGRGPAPDQKLICVDGLPLRACVNHDGSPRQPMRPNGPLAGSLGAMIGQFKSRATKRIWALPGVGRIPIWQRNYYEHIIRDDLEYERFIQYIQTNPLHWQEDQLHTLMPPVPYSKG